MKQPAMPLLFRVGAVQFDEARLELRVAGELRAIEAKPLALLVALLKSAGTVATKRPLIEAVWGNADHISEASLTTAMFKLRAALGDRERGLIEVVHGSGYRLTLPVSVTPARDTPRLAISFSAGQPVPGRPQWRLERGLGMPPLNDVWLARHDETDECRVFKFADSTARREVLQREVTLSRVLRTALGVRDDLVRILEWNLAEPPYFIESAYGGVALPSWVEAQGGLLAVALDTRVAMAAQVARTIASAHSAGVLHGDIKPGNILVAPERHGMPRLAMVDFGAGGLSDLAQIADLDPALRGPTAESGAGAALYQAPEVLAGGARTTGSDIYALGILLYQLVAASLDRTLAVGWESDIADELLREDIAAAASGDPARRLGAAASLAERLESLQQRHTERRRRQQADRAAAALAVREERDRVRRPWIIGVCGSLVAGLLLSLGFGVQALRERDLARKEVELAHAVTGFLTEDLLGRGNPAQSGRADESLMQAAQAAQAGIGRRLRASPVTAGSIYLSLAHVFDSRGMFDPARTAYRNAIASFRTAGQIGRASLVMALLQAATLDITSGQPGSMRAAQRMIAEGQAGIAGLGGRRREAEVWLHVAKGVQQMQGGDVRIAQAEYRLAADEADTLPASFDIETRLALRQREAYTHLRLGEWTVAENLFRDLLRHRLALDGPRYPETLRVALNLAQVHVSQGFYAAALPELDRLYPDFVEVFGADHRRTLQLLAVRGQALTQLGRYDEALRDQMAIYRAAVATQGDHSFFALATLGDAALSRCRAGQSAPGLAAARAAYAGATASFGRNAALVGDIQGVVAFCLIVAGQYAQAAPLLDGIDVAAVSQLTIDPDYGAEIALMRADIESKIGDAAIGQALLRKVAPAFERPDGDTFMRQWARRLLAAQAGLDTPTQY